MYIYVDTCTYAYVKFVCILIILILCPSSPEYLIYVSPMLIFLHYCSAYELVLVFLFYLLIFKQLIKELLQFLCNCITCKKKYSFFKNFVVNIM